MDYLEFTNQIRETVKRRCGGETQVSVGQVMKSNRNLVDTLAVLKPGDNMSPAFYISQLYEQYRGGMTVEEIAERIAKCYQEDYQGGRVDFSFYADYARVRERVACRLVNYEKNRELLSKVPHRRYLDLAVVYYCRVDQELLRNDSFGKGSILIQNVHMAMWNITPEQLHDAAVTNTVRQLPYELVGLGDMLHDMLDLNLDHEAENAAPMYVLTNTEKWYGAVNILFDSVLEAVGERLKSDFYVLPSSIHECMIIPVTAAVRGEELRQMVHEINEEYVAAEEVLGESVYLYNRKAHLLACAG